MGKIEEDSAALKVKAANVFLIESQSCSLTPPKCMFLVYLLMLQSCSFQTLRGSSQRSTFPLHFSYNPSHLIESCHSDNLKIRSYQSHHPGFPRPLWPSNLKRLWIPHSLTTTRSVRWPRSSHGLLFLDCLQRAILSDSEPLQP